MRSHEILLDERVNGVGRDKNMIPAQAMVIITLLMTTAVILADWFSRDGM